MGDLIFMLSESQEKRKGRAQKTVEETDMGISKYCKTHKLKNSFKLKTFQKHKHKLI